MEAHEIIDGAWYAHPDHGVVWQCIYHPEDNEVVGHECELVVDGTELVWRTNGKVIFMDDEFLADLRWAWGGDTREVTITIKVPVGDPNRGADVIDPVVNTLLACVDLGVLGEDDWWVDND